MTDPDPMPAHPDEPSGPAACPPAADLSYHARAELPCGDAARLDRHLGECPPCLRTFLESAHETLVPQIPDCHVVSEIGRGRFGIVYKAWWLKDPPRVVALKVLSGAGQMERSRFEREIAVLKKIDSPGIVRCLESRVTSDAAYYVMEFVHGVHLDEYVTKSAASLVQKLRVFERVCRAVADAHAAGVVHRDLKPRNIVVDEHGQPHILDFGICTLETPDWSSWVRQTITRAGDIIGTLRYMSPEQAWGGVAGPIDERSDIWSLGVMLYEIVTGGDYPYSLTGTADRPPHEHLLEQIRKELPRLRRLDSIPRGRDLEVLLERCLAWELHQRIPSVAQLADDLARYCRGERLLTRPLSIPHRIKRLAVGAATGYRWACSAALVACLAVAMWMTAYVFHVGWRVSPVAHPSRGVTGEVGAHDITRVVGVSDSTVHHVIEWAARSDVPGVTSDVRTWRGVHGLLMMHLAAAEPRALIWDYFFQEPKAADELFVAGVRRLEEAGVPVVLAAADYHADGTPVLSPQITGALGSRLRHGGIAARDMVSRPGEFVLAVRPAEDVGPAAADNARHSIIPSVALTTLGALIHPEARLDLDWPARQRELALMYEVQPGAYLRRRDTVELATVFEARRREASVRPGDLIGGGRFLLQSPEQWAERTIPYERLLDAPADELHAEVAGRILVVGDMQTAVPLRPADRHRVQYGVATVDDVPGCYLLADAIAGLIDGGYVRSAFPLPAATFLSVLLLGGLGCTLAIGLGRLSLLQERRGRRTSWCLILAGATAGWLALVLSRNDAVVHAGLAGVSVLAPLAGSLWVELARNRHRIFERKRQAVEQLHVPIDGTLTLATLRPTSLPTAG